MMKGLIIALKVALLAVAGTVLLILFWTYVIPGILLGWIFRDRYKDWIGSVTALLIVLGLRYSSGSWPTSFGEAGSNVWYVELSSAVLSWAVGSILVSAGFNIPQHFLEGLKSGVGSGGH